MPKNTRSGSRVRETLARTADRIRLRNLIARIDTLIERLDVILGPRPVHVSDRTITDASVRIEPWIHERLERGAQVAKTSKRTIAKAHTIARKIAKRGGLTRGSNPFAIGMAQAKKTARKAARKRASAKR